MKTKLLAVTAVFAALSLSACDNNTKKATDLPPGQYENTTTSTDANGTEHERTTTTDVQQNSDGSKSATIHNETTHDPEGLLNKEKTSETTTHETSH